MRHFISFKLVFVIIFIISPFKLNAATISSFTQMPPPMEFGRVASGTATGTVSSNPAITPTGTRFKSFDTRNSASFLVQGTNNTAGTTAPRRLLRVYLNSRTGTMTNGGNSIPITSFTIPTTTSTGCTIGNCTTTRCDITLPMGTGIQSCSVTIVGIASVTTGKAAGDYNGTYRVRACSCPSAGCPASFTACT